MVLALVMVKILSRSGSVADDGDDDGEGCEKQADECKVEHGRHGVDPFEIGSVEVSIVAAFDEDILHHKCGRSRTFFGFCCSGG